MQNEAALGFDRSPAHHFYAAGARRQPDDVGRGNDVQLHQKVGEIDVRRWMIDDNAHRPFRRMRADVNERAGKALVHHRRHGDQHLAVEIASAPALGRCAARRFHK
jgi:hypothetical protein